MKHRLLYIPIAFLLLLSFVDCAKKGTPSGGPRDTIPPVIVRSSPENYSTNFSGDEIEIRFDEYIKLKDLDNQLVISPPLEFRPVITPLNVSKTLKIKIIDTLKTNTTYSFNFGKSIVDNNEEVEFEYFKYVFSTGNYIDSLKVSGNIRDAELISPEIPTTVMLYEANENYSDSLIYSKKPTYVTVTKDSTGYFELTNLKEGKYVLLALNEKSSDYTFQPRHDKIGFVEAVVSVPTDSVFTLTLFKETLPYKLSRPSQVGKNHIIFGYEGDADELQIETLTSVPADFVSTVIKDETKDSLHYWFKPSIDMDSLVFKVSNKELVDTAVVRMRELFRDSLTVSAIQTGTLKNKDTFKLRATTPLVSFDASKFQIMAKDSTIIEPTIKLNPKYNWAEVYFHREEDQSYSINLFPQALTDFFETTNDTLRFNINTQNSAVYGTLHLRLENAYLFPVIVQLVNGKYEVVEEAYIREAQNANSDTVQTFFDEITPGKYFLRVIFDKNGNGKWDTGIYLDRRDPERILYYPSPIDVRANWSLNETFILN